MLLSKILDVIAAILYLSLVFLGFYLGFRKSLKVFVFIIFITFINSVIFRIFKHFLVKEYLEIIDVGVVFISSLFSFLLFLPLVNKILDFIPEVDIVMVNRMLGFLLFILNGIFLLGYFVIFTDFIPSFYYFFETSAFFRFFSNVVKFIVGISLF
ncbi:MAG: hypothetical protein ACPL4C_01295 [Brevinematia bacterium]